MPWIILTVVVAFLLFGAPPMVRRAMQGVGATDEATTNTHIGLVWGRIVLILVWAVITALNSFQQVPAGHVGVIKTFGAITGQVDQGFTPIAPWSTVQTVSTQVDKLHYPKLAAFSKETQNVFISASLNASVSRVAIQQLMTEVGPDYQKKLIDSRVANYVKEESVKFAATDVAPHREDIRVAVRDRLKADLKPYSITVIDFLIDNIRFDTAFENSIIAKQVATQEAQKEQANVAKETAKANQVIERSKGEAGKIKNRADAQAAANRELAASLTDKLIQQNAIDKINPNVKVIVVPSGSVNVNNLGDLAGQIANNATGTAGK